MLCRFGVDVQRKRGSDQMRRRLSSCIIRSKERVGKKTGSKGRKKDRKQEREVLVQPDREKKQEIRIERD